GAAAGARLHAAGRGGLRRPLRAGESLLLRRGLPGSGLAGRGDARPGRPHGGCRPAGADLLRRAEAADRARGGAASRAPVAAARRADRRPRPPTSPPPLGPVPRLGRGGDDAAGDHPRHGRGRPRRLPRPDGAGPGRRGWDARRAPRALRRRRPRGRPPPPDRRDPARIAIVARRAGRHGAHRPPIGRV
ncbi:MAG: Efflux ABC transporter, ATP-binding protein, partial [uncultured Thermomicrobiales bacterium]